MSENTFTDTDLAEQVHNSATPIQSRRPPSTPYVQQPIFGAIISWALSYPRCSAFPPQCCFSYRRPDVTLFQQSPLRRALASQGRDKGMPSHLLLSCSCFWRCGANEDDMYCTRY